MEKHRYYFDYSEESYNYLMNSNILRNSEKQLLKEIISGKTVEQLAKENNCSEMTICRKRKKIFELTKTLMDYNSSYGNIDEYYENQKSKLKTYGEDVFKVVSNETNLYKVYLLTFPNEKVYVGITSQDEKTRWNNGEGYIENQVMYNDILKYGWINIKKNILYRDLTFEEAREKEKELIINYKSHLRKYGYNRSF